MAENPYEAPKTVEPLAPSHSELFDRLNRYVRRAFYTGLLMVLITAPISFFENRIIESFFKTVGILGFLLVAASIIAVIPLSLWGFVKGYREGKASVK